MFLFSITLHKTKAAWRTSSAFETERWATLDAELLDSAVVERLMGLDEVESWLADLVMLALLARAAEGVGGNRPGILSTFEFDLVTGPAGQRKIEMTRMR